MCFSAEASFAGGVIISAIGVVTIMKVHKPSQIIFASIPLFFGVQQFAEGFLWMTIANPEYVLLHKISTYFFLTMADFLWPVMIPLSVLLMEEKQSRKKYLWGLLGLGMLLSGYYGFCLLAFHVTPQVMGHHIHYANDFPMIMAKPAFAIYLIATITPLYVSSVKRTHVLGILMFFSCLVAVIFFTQYLTSVWCFFAALISAVIFWILRDSKSIFILEKLEELKKQIQTVKI